jgi:hypothetical protein
LARSTPAGCRSTQSIGEKNWGSLSVRRAGAKWNWERPATESTMSWSSGDAGDRQNQGRRTGRLETDGISAVSGGPRVRRPRRLAPPPPVRNPRPYAVLGLDSVLPGSRDPDLVHAHYRRLSFLLNWSNPDRPCLLLLGDFGDEVYMLLLAGRPPLHCKMSLHRRMHKLQI